MCYYGKKCGCEGNECDGSCVDVAGCNIADSDDCCYDDSDGDSHSGDDNNCCCGNEG